VANQYAKMRIVHVVNRTLEPLESMWDGVPYVIPPGYVREQAVDAEGLPRVDGKGAPVMAIVGAGRNPAGERVPIAVAMEYYSAEAAKRQNPIPGTLSPDLHLEYQMYIGVIEFGDEITYAPPSEAIELLDRSQLPADRQHIESRHIPGAGRKSTTKAKRRQIYVVGPNAQVLNPGGGKFEYAGGADFTR
jgi:hypothetical protein